MLLYQLCFVFVLFFCLSTIIYKQRSEKSFGNLTNRFFKSNCKQIRDTVMKTLNSAALKDLPSVVKFLQQTVSEADVTKVCAFDEKNINSSL